MASRSVMAVLAVSGLLTASMAQAEGGRYSGFSVGETGVKVNGGGFDESDVGFKWFGGIMVNPHVGVELAYIWGGKLDANSGLVRSVETNTFSIEGIGRLPIGEKFALFGKAGLGFYNAYVYPRAGGAYSNSDEEFIYGVGGMLTVNPKIEIRLEWQQLDFSTSAYKGDFSMLSLGLAFRF